MAQSQIIIIGSNADRDLPEHVKSWFESSGGLNRYPQAWVVVFDQSASGSNYRKAISEYLQNCARNHGVDFFAALDAGPEVAEAPRLSSEYESAARVAIGA